jgi:2,3-bisphosphoglycerate-independent phosphoglycerate mutase
LNKISQKEVSLRSFLLRNMKKKKLVLIILDGWGHGRKDVSNAIYEANTPFISGLYKNHPNAELLTDGENVGLPAGQMGNSEVGHLNIGAGRIVYQDLVKINKAIADGSINDNPVLKEALNTAKANGKKVHFMGLVSKGGVHSSQEHLYALCDMAKAHGLEDVFIHAFTDGRDTDPKSGIGYLTELQEHLNTSVGEIASVTGRYYAMDRDKRWERVKLAYDALTEGNGNPTNNVLEAITASYEANVTDEFIEPIVKVNAEGNPIATIEPEDVVICFNFRTDRCREITMALTQQEFTDHNMHTIPLHYVTMTNYDNSYKGVQVVFEKDNLKMTLGEVLSKNGKSQIRIAETEKYPHVTFFFSGGRELEFEGEKRLMVNSPKVATYDLQPEMSAYQVTDTITAELTKGEVDYVCLNFANPDMVGHTGVKSAIIKAVETIDECARKVVETGTENGYSFIIIADHGNADFVINEDGSPNTAHTTNPVPVFLIDEYHKSISNGILADVAPTILQIMGVPIPEEMTGKVLVEEAVSA